MLGSEGPAFKFVLFSRLGHEEFCHFGSRLNGAVAVIMQSVAFLTSLVQSINNGLFWESPPMGWRSWNCYHDRVNQSIMEAVMNTVTRPYRHGRSLASFGYKDVGLDDAWQMCGAGINGSFHDIHGNPIVDRKKFPDMKAMVDRAHSLGLTAGWYGNN